ncbi:MAG TPA: hypothetical protein VD835_14385, partial [Pyrinomonadaceae bacterium]|nr:hypothetical protein [Pyrinomonadaceae bacterium]
MHIILLKVEHKPPARALLETLRAAGLCAEEWAAVGSCGTDVGGVAASPLALICEVTEGASVGE